MDYCKSRATEVRNSTNQLQQNTCKLRSDTNDSSFQMGLVYNVTVRAENGDAGPSSVGYLINFDTNKHGMCLAIEMKCWDIMTLSKTIVILFYTMCFILFRYMRRVYQNVESLNWFG